MERKRKRRISETGVQYGQVAEALREEIRRGIYDGLHAFPSLTQIMKRFGISRPCAAKSVAELKRMGLVVTIVGSGTHVKNRTIGVAIPGTADSEFFRAIQDTIRGSCRERGVEMVAGDFSKDHACRAEEFVRLARHFVERKVASFDDVQIAGAAEPAITTIHQPCAKLAATAFQALMSRIDNPYLPPCQILLDAPLVVRASTGRRM